MSANPPIDEVSFVADSGEVSRAGRVATLTPVQMDLFENLYDAHPRFRSRDLLFDDLYGRRGEAAEPDPKIIDVQLTHLRKKLKPLGIAFEVRWGIGWRLDLKPLPAPEKDTTMKNRLTDLNDHLFMQLERLSDEELSDDRIESEVKRAEAMVQVADRIVDNARLGLQAAKLVADHGDRFMKHLPMLSGPKEPVE